jgi:mono/diheme cytochrome c family protein
MRGGNEAGDERRRSPLTRLRLSSLGIAGLLMLATLASVITPTGAQIAAQEREALAARGKALFMEKGCHGCHTIDTVGTPIGPDLSAVRRKYREDEITRWLSPSVQEPTQGRRMHSLDPADRDLGRLLSHMPTPRLSESEAQALAAYLASLP